MSIILFTDPQAEQYLSAVRSKMKSLSTTEERTIHKLRRDMRVYAQNGGEMTYEALAAHFGQPEDYARAHIRDVDPVTLTRKMAFGRFVKWTVLIAVVLVILIVLICWLCISYYASLPTLPEPGA